MIEADRSIRVLLADDHAIVRNGVAQILNEQQGISVVARAADGAKAVELFASIRPDVALIDLPMPTGRLQVVEKIRESFPDAAIVILTTYDTDNDIERARCVPVPRHFSSRTCRRRSSWPACTRGARVSPKVAAKLVAHVTNVRLTRRELAVLSLVAAGHSDLETGDLPGTSDGTVKIHLTHRSAKLDVTSRVEAIATALRRGLVRID